MSNSWHDLWADFLITDVIYKVIEYDVWLDDEPHRNIVIDKAVVRRDQGDHISISWEWKTRDEIQDDMKAGYVYAFVKELSWERWGSPKFVNLVAPYKGARFEKRPEWFLRLDDSPVCEDFRMNLKV